MAVLVKDAHKLTIWGSESAFSNRVHFLATTVSSLNTHGELAHRHCRLFVYVISCRDSLVIAPQDVHQY